MEDYAQGTLRKELRIDLFIERFETVTFGNSYW